MRNASQALGDQIAPPEEFHPTERWTDRYYSYQFDVSSGIIKRTPIHPQAGAGGFYVVLEASLAGLTEAAETAPEQALKAMPQSHEMADLGVTKRPRTKKRRQWPIRMLTTTLTTIFVGAALLLIYPYLPEANYQVQQALPHHADTQAATNTPIANVNHLNIPKIGVSANILESPSLDILKTQEGVWHQTGSLKDGNLVLAGHRFKYLPPNSTTFYNLGKLTPGDVIVIDWLHKRNVYVVRDVQTVSAENVDVLKQVGPARLTLYTCDDKKQTRRIVVTADPLP